jgi:hypothetical protein
MILKARRPSPSRLIAMGLTTSLTVLFLFGCGQREVTPVADHSHGEQVTKNMQDFMKNNPYKSVAKPRIQTK